MVLTAYQRLRGLLGTRKTVTSLEVQVRQARGRIDELTQRLEFQRGELQKRKTRIIDLQSRLGRSTSGPPAQSRIVNPANILWIFGSPRSGTTWLRDMLCDSWDARAWEEPFVGDLFGNFYYERAREGQLKAKNFIMGEPTRKTWIGAIRGFVLTTLKGRFPDIGPDTRVVVKEPNGSQGAPLLMEALPESKMILILRDPRDVVASALDARREGSWLYERRRMTGAPARDHPEKIVEERADLYARYVTNARKAYETHRGQKILVRYEDLLNDTPEVLTRIHVALGLAVDGEVIRRTVEKHSWESIPETERGQGRFYRKATPGGWKEDLTPEQAKMIKVITRPIFDEFYSEKQQRRP